MMITGSCGHRVNDQGPDGMGWNIAIKSYSKDGSRAVAYLCVCTECYRAYAKEGAVLDTEAEQMEYLNESARYVEVRRKDCGGCELQQQHTALINELEGLVEEWGKPENNQDSNSKLCRANELQTILNKQRGEV